MSDRELLEAAAKAAGVDVRCVGNGEPNGAFSFYAGPEGLWWNPLEDDGDALRLAVKLRLTIQPDGCVVYATPPRTVVRRLGLGIISAEFTPDDELNPEDEAGRRYLEYLRKNYPGKTISVSAATRRAIVRAAAALANGAASPNTGEAK